MPDQKPDNQRTKQVPVSSDDNGGVTFDLGLNTPEEKQDHKVKAIHQAVKETKAEKVKAANKTGRKLWGILDWVTTSIAIFLVLFLILNYQSYSELFWTKVDQIKGTVATNPFSEQEAEKIRRAAPESQEPLPIVRKQEDERRQIPDLNLDIAPPDDRVIIPRINKNVPVIRVSTEKLIQRDWAALEDQIQDALRFGVVHFPGTALPGNPGNVVITGHSSYFPWDPGRFKDVFALLHQVSVGDEVIVYHKQDPFKYIVYDKKVVSPDQIEVLTQKGEDRLTLITCTPVGTDLNRLIIFAKPV